MMIKIGKTVLYGILFGLLILVSLDAIFRETVSYKLIIMYIILLSLTPYASNMVKFDKNLGKPFLMLVLSILFICFGEYIYAFHKNSMLLTGSLFMAAGIAVLLFRDGQEPDENPWGVTKQAEFLLVSAVMLIAFALRFYDLTGLPGAIWYDEAQNGNEAIDIMNGRLPGVFIGRLTEMPAMFFYIAAFFMKLFGTNLFSMRIISALLGSLSVLGFYFLCRRIFKDVPLALAGAFILCVTRWHITFSRVAFLGMQTLFLEVITMYFYILMLEKKDGFSAAAAGAAMGLNLYTFSSADFVPVIILAHLVLKSMFEGGKFIEKTMNAAGIMFGMFVITSLPLAVYAENNLPAFLTRMHDLSIMNDIKSTRSLEPLIQSIKSHLLMFNYEGDYNGRHNLYKKPMLDMVTGVLFVVGLITAFTRKEYALFAAWFAVSLGAGLLTISVEAPQAYRIIGIIPCVCIMVVIAIKEIRAMLYALNRKKRWFVLLLAALLAAAAVINIKQYYFEYPKEAATYMDFSPVANAMAKVMLEDPGYTPMATLPLNIYSYFVWEQKVICDFLTMGKIHYGYLKSGATIDTQNMQKGALIILRPTDTVETAAVQKQYPDAVKQEYRNQVTDEIMFVCYYIGREMIKKDNVLLRY
jgi:4-amino-4-deoxy-L-arabinose transferase-like glycosyltransferase